MSVPAVLESQSSVSPFCFWTVQDGSAVVKVGSMLVAVRTNQGPEPAAVDATVTLPCPVTLPDTANKSAVSALASRTRRAPSARATSPPMESV